VADQHLATYLHDHRAGAVVALELLAHLEKTHAGTDLERFAATLRADIEADKRELEALTGRLNLGSSLTRKATAWLGEKLTELKLRLDDPAHGALHRLEILEAVSVGIEGKRALWRSLATAAETAPRLRGPDYGHLVRRAEEQRQRMEPLRLAAAREALGDPGSP
jgi:hypothetical protein